MSSGDGVAMSRILCIVGNWAVGRVLMIKLRIQLLEILGNMVKGMKLNEYITTFLSETSLRK